MIFETHALTEPLQSLVTSIFYYKGLMPDHSIERVVPTGHVFILFELDGIPRNTFDNGTLEINGVYSESWISGMHKNYLSISAHANSEMLVVQLDPAGILPFIHRSAHELNNQVIAATDIFGEEFKEIRKAIIEAEEIREKFQIIEEWLLHRLDDTKKPNPILVTLLEELKAKPVKQHAKVINSYPKSQKHLISQFKKYFGLTPKVMHRIYRFNEILQEIHSKKSVTWSQVAYDFDYADQSHFIKEFKEFSGFNPQEFIVSGFQNEPTNFFPLDRE